MGQKSTASLGQHDRFCIRCFGLSIEFTQGVADLHIVLQDNSEGWEEVGLQLRDHAGVSCSTAPHQGRCGLKHVVVEAWLRGVFADL